MIKKFILLQLILLFCLYSPFVEAQKENKNTFTTYYTKNGHKTTIKSEANYYTIRPKSIQKFTGNIKQFYTSNDTLKNIIQYKHGTKTGIEKSYYPTGILYKETKNNDNREVGPRKIYYPTGILALSEEIEDVAKNKSKVISGNDSSGKTVISEGNGLFDFTDIKGRRTTGLYQQGKKVGEWTGYRDDGSINYKEQYTSGELTKGNSWDKWGEKHEYTKLEEEAHPEKGMLDFRTHIAKYLSKNYPKKALKKGTTGIVYINFYVDTDGTPIEFNVLKGIGNGCDEASIQAIKTYGVWIGARQRGIPVIQGFNFPVKFKHK